MPKYKLENECINKQKSTLPKQKKIYVIEAKYIFDDSSCLKWLSRKDWFVWKKYETAKQRENALQQLKKVNSNRDYLEFRKGTP